MMPSMCMVCAELTAAAQLSMLSQDAEYWQSMPPLEVIRICGRCNQK